MKRKQKPSHGIKLTKYKAFTKSPAKHSFLCDFVVARGAGFEPARPEGPQA
uniref:Uncharacterized protein n=1 Tax=uncultured marine crenarchaeote E48-1C TaxID=907718 RepID=G9BAS3_9ARCH|nr:hypothetical protein E48-1C_3 [uncultured marine crenarchaeote E48-1C]